MSLQSFWGLPGDSAVHCCMTIICQPVPTTEGAWALLPGGENASAEVCGGE